METGNQIKQYGGFTASRKEGILLRDILFSRECFIKMI